MVHLSGNNVTEHVRLNVKGHALACAETRSLSDQRSLASPLDTRNELTCNISALSSTHAPAFEVERLQFSKSAMMMMLHQLRHGRESVRYRERYTTYSGP
jgi:hypothetical protein